MTRISLLTSVLAALALSPAAVDAKPKNCPPGLAKKSPACVPPGQAKKGVTAGEWQARRGDDADDDHRRRYDDDWDIGDRVDRNRWLVLEEGDRVVIDGREYVVVDTDNGTVLRADDDWYRLPEARSGTEWVRVGDRVIRVDRDSREIVELIELSRLLLN